MYDIKKMSLPVDGSDAVCDEVLAKKFAEYIMDCVRSSFSQTMTDIQTQCIGNLAPSISADNNDGSFHMHIRIYPISLSFEEFDVDINYICLPEEHQRKGLFSEFVHLLCRISNIRRIIISSIVTPEMHSWCDAHGFYNRMPYDENTRYLNVECDW